MMFYASRFGFDCLFFRFTKFVTLEKGFIRIYRYL